MPGACNDETDTDWRHKMRQTIKFCYNNNDSAIIEVVCGSPW